MKESAVHPGQGSGTGGKRTLGKAMTKGGLLFKNKNPTNVGDRVYPITITSDLRLDLQILRQEEEVRARTSTASDTYRAQVKSTQAIRQEYFNLQLPRILRVSTQHHPQKA